MEPTIKLDQFLKREGFAFSGGDAKQMIQAGVVFVNGEIETRRGRQLKRGDKVTVEDVTKIVDTLRDD